MLFILSYYSLLKVLKYCTIPFQIWHLGAESFFYPKSFGKVGVMFLKSPTLNGL